MQILYRFLEEFGEKKLTSSAFREEEIVRFLEKNKSSLSVETQIFFDKIFEAYNYEHLPSVEEVYEKIRPILTETDKEKLFDILIPALFFWIQNAYSQKSMAIYLERVVNREHRL